MSTPITVKVPEAAADAISKASNQLNNEWHVSAMLIRETKEMLQFLKRTRKLKNPL